MFVNQVLFDRRFRRIILKKDLRKFDLKISTSLPKNTIGVNLI